MDQNSLGCLGNTHISEFNSQLSLYFLCDDKNDKNRLQGVNFSTCIGNLRKESKKMEELKQSRFSHVKKSVSKQWNVES
jgi:hypothetical protein